MARHDRLPLLLLAVAALLCGAREASACSCAGSPTVLEEYEGAGVVVVARIFSVEKPKEAAGEGRAVKKPVGSEEKAQAKEQEPEGAEELEGADGLRQATIHGGALYTRMLIERTYKGTLKAGEEMIFANGGSSCDWAFDEKDVGRRFLFYLRAPEKNQKFWHAGGCGRDRGVERAADDLLYLNNLPKVRGRTRLSGTLAFDSGNGMSVANKTIRVIGAKKTHEIKTDENGVYEIYDLPAGKYLIEPETPPGWKVDAFWLSQSPSYAGGGEDGPRGGKAAKGIPVVVDEKRHAGLDIHFEIDNAVRGKILDAQGRPMNGVCLDLVPADGTKGAYLADCTEQGGAFEINEIPPGGYVIVVNDDGEVTSDEPFGTFYYPNAAKREEAAVIHIGAGEFIEGLQIHAPAAAETITVEGLFLYSNGKPVADEYVEFVPEKTAGDEEDAGKPKVEGGAKAKTDEAGRFSIKILKGLKGKLYGGMYTYAGEFENCPKLEAIIKKSGGSVPDIKTPGLAISADAYLSDIKLLYPFPGCKKAKPPE